MLAGALCVDLMLLDQSEDKKFSATEGLVGNAIFLRGEYSSTVWRRMATEPTWVR